MSLKDIRLMGKNIDPNVPLDQQKNVTLIEYISIALARVGGMLGTTLTGTLATTFLLELYLGPVGVDSKGVARVTAVQTTISTVLGIIMPLIAGIVAQKWKSRWGRYRQWYVICSIPIFLLTVSFYYVPKGWSVENMILLRYIIASMQVVLNNFNNLGQNIAQVVSPNFKEKKTVATVWQFAYYLGYGGAYLGTFVYGVIMEKQTEMHMSLENMYMTLSVIAACVTIVGNLMCGIFCKERIELPKKEKVSVSKALFSLFKYRNYRAYQYIQWANALAALGRWSTYLVAITVGSSKNLLLTLPTAIGTVVGNVICTKISSKYEPTKLLKFCGFYSTASAALVFFTCLIESSMGIYFFEGWNGIFFYAFYFLFGIGVGIQELSTSHFTVEYYDYLEWQMGDRYEAVQGIIPGWINSGVTYVKELAIPYIIVMIGYKSSEEGNLVKTMQADPHYLRICMWLVALLVFTYALSNVLKALILKFLYNVEGETKAQMYRELEEMRKKRHEENKNENSAESAAEVTAE